MALIHIDKLAAGMVLQEDVCDRSGRVLLPAGSELTEKHLLIFRTWGVLEAEITAESDRNSEDTEGGEPVDPILLAAAESAVMSLFTHNDLEHPAIKELFRICIARKVANGA